MSRNTTDAVRGRFYSRLSFSARIKLFTAVFFIFAPIGLLLVNRFAAVRPWQATSVYFAFSGLQAVGWAYAFFANRYRILYLVVAAQVLWVVMPWAFPVTSGPSFAMSFEGIGSVVAIAAGYALFVMFIAGEGARSVRLETEMSLAREIHDALIPPVTGTVDRYELFGASRPGSEMGGDLLDIVAGNGRLGVYVADVSGHGVRAGVVMGMVKSAIRMKVRSTSDLQELLNDLNAVLLDLLTPGMFVTGAFLRFNETSTADFSGAGHGPVLHYHATSGNVTEIESRHLPLGVSPSEEFGSTELAFEPGDVLLLMTDGLTEVFDGQGRILGQAPLESVFRENVRRPLAELHSAILCRVEEHGPQMDDQTLLLIRIL
jgi:serine phosphatase RsbU (regulator of sigma subunit)